MPSHGQQKEPGQGAGALSIVARRLRSCRAAVLVVGLVSAAHADGAAPQREVVWRPEWNRFSTSDYAFTGMTLAAMVGYLTFATDEPPRWHTPLPGEDGIRHALRLHSKSARDRADAVSHRLYQGLVLYPYAVDVLGVALIGHRSPDVAGQMALLNTEALALTGLLSYVSNQLFLRERPHRRECGDTASPECPRGNYSDSFFSGHTSISFTSAALTCMHHAYLPLYGQSGVGDTLACVGLMTAAATGGVLRIASDQHYAADILVGAGVGLASGLLVPWLHYRGHRTDPSPSTSGASGARLQAMPWLAPGSLGLSTSGTFLEVSSPALCASHACPEDPDIRSGLRQAVLDLLGP